MARLAALLVLSLAGVACAPRGEPDSGSKSRVLILVVDGLRPDYVTSSLMPRLNALAESGVRASNHHAVFPTVTRVNGPSIFTGQYPGGHGLLGNSVYLPGVDSLRVLSAGEREDLLMIDEAMSGELLTAPSLGEILHERGLTFFAASSGSTGSGTLMNHRGAGAGLVHHAFTVPDSLGPIVARTLGPPPDGPSVALVARAVDALLEIGVDRADADVLAAWLTEPDGTAHQTGIGSPETVQVLAEVDAEIGRLLDGLEERGVLPQTNILVTSDHGFARRVGNQSLTDLLVESGLKTRADSRDVVVAGSAIHVREGGPSRVQEIVELLQRTDWIGPVFTSPGGGSDLVGRFSGTVSFTAIGWDHARSADILTSPTWNDAVNDFGYAGAVLSPGVAGHGSASPWDIRSTFLAAGPDIKRGVVTDVPTGNIDLVPTALALLGLETDEPFDGRALTEITTAGPDPAMVTVVPEPVTVSTGGYELTVSRVRVGGTTYFSGTSVTRSR